MKHGATLDIAFALSDLSGDPENAALGLAMAIVFGEFEGGEFDWDRMTWKKRDG